MKIRLLPAALALALLPAAVLNAPAAHADEGMWQPSQMPELGDRLRELGLRMDPQPVQSEAGQPDEALLVGLHPRFVIDLDHFREPFFAS